MRDIAVKKDGDVYLQGDIEVADTTDYHKKNVLLAKPGDFKHAPDLGVNLRMYVNTNNIETLLRSIRKNLLSIGMNVISLQVDRGVLTEESRYEES